MDYKTRLTFILKYSKIHVFALISFFYGLLFGGLFNLGELVGEKASIGNFLFGSLATGGIYFCIFSIAVIAIYIGKNTKAFISLSMSRKNIIKMWNEIIIYMASINTVIIMLLAIWGPNYATDMPRLLDMDFRNLSIIDALVLIVFIWVSNQLIIQLTSLVTNIGNRYSIVLAFTCLISSLALIVLSIIPLLNLIIWGELLIPVILIITILNSVLFLVNRHLLKHVEVTR